MAVTFSTLGHLYSNYANASLPWNKLHAYSAKLATAPQKPGHVLAPAAGTPAAPMAASAQSSRAKVYAYRAAVVPHHIMRLPDVVFGTGVHLQGHPIKIMNGNDAVAHVSECLRSPFDSGLIGLAQGLSFLKAVANGAFFGALFGAIVCASPKTIDTCAATGALLSAALLWLTPALVLSAANGALRAVTSLTKFAVVGAFYGAGYAVGSIVDQYFAERSTANG